MEHVVFYPSTDGGEAHARVPSLEQALQLVERLRNEGGHEASLHALHPVPVTFRAYYHVEVPTVLPAQAGGGFPAPALAPAPTGDGEAATAEASGPTHDAGENRRYDDEQGRGPLDPGWVAPVEVTVDRAPVEGPTGHRTTGDRTTADQARGDQATVDQATVDQTTAAQATNDQAAVDQAAVDQAAYDQAMNEPAASDQAMNEPAASDQAAVPAPREARQDGEPATTASPFVTLPNSPPPSSGLGFFA